jgi:hypothetical protein
MAETIKFTCDRCKNDIKIDRKNECGAVFFKKKYYHQNCFCELCKEKAANKRSLLSWQKELDNILEYQNAAMPNIDYRFAKEDLNEWILQHYNIIEVPRRFWSIVADLENGKRNGSKCNPVKTKLVFETWRWGQQNLDSINRKNKRNKKGPKNDTERLNYDLSIIIKHIPDYIKAKAKQDAEEAEREAKAKETIRIDYNKFNNTAAKAEGLDDISDLLDEF